MRGDFSRDTFVEAHRFTRVLMQQGRVHLDADWNEQMSILLHYLQSVTADVVGKYGGPLDNLGYTVTAAGKGDFSLSPGHYYVDGLLCENGKENYTSSEKGLFYTQQVDLPDVDALKAPEDGGQQNYLVYLDVWERHLTFVQEEDLREVALNGPDTASRARLVTQTRVSSHLGDEDIPDTIPANINDWKDWLFKTQPNEPSRWEKFVRARQPVNRGMLKAIGKPANHKDTDVCLASPDGHYRGTENQLYRVEIHRSGKAWDEKTGADGQAGAATFKWSRENGCVVFPLQHLALSGDGTTAAAIIERARDDRLGLHVGEWVEVVSDVSDLYSRPGPLAEVKTITPLEDPTCQQVLLRVPENTTLPKIGDADQNHHPLLRRWDSRPQMKDLDPNEEKELLANTGGALLVEEGEWLPLEDGVQVWFEPQPNGDQPAYRSGDYWLIPARTAIEDVIWPGGMAPIAQPPQGITHHYAPLAILPVGAGNNAVTSLQTTFKTLGELSNP